MTETNGGRPTSEERIERQERDNGAPEDTVWQATGGSYKSLRYHDDRNCSYLNQSDGDPEDMARAEAKARWLAPCTHCVPLAPEASRQAVYRGLLSAIGRYFYHEAHVDGYDQMVSFDDDEPYKPILDWVMEGKEPTVRAFHVWGVGGGRGEGFSYDYCKDREIGWNASDEAWVVKESEKYVINGARNAPGRVPEGPEEFTECRRVSV